MDNENDGKAVRILCRKLVLINNETGLQWLVGSPFFPPLTIASTFRCIHTLPSNPLSPDFPKESDDLRTLLLKGFEVIGALIAGNNLHLEQNAGEAIDVVRKLRKALSGDTASRDLIGGVVDWNRTEDVRFFVSRSGDTSGFQSVSGVAYEDEGEKYMLGRYCLTVTNEKTGEEAEDIFTRATEAVAAKFRDPKVTYIMETLNEPQTEAPEPLVIRGGDLDFQAELSSASLSSETDQVPDVKSTTCSYFCSTRKDTTSFTSVEELNQYHFNPPGFLHPVSVIYELNYGETEMKQVSGGVVSLIQGSYEYHHYLQDGFDDSGWGCAYRSLQTIISWFRLQHYTSIDVPSHREIQQSLVEIGDKDPSFTGSHDWIGAIELSFVLDKLLGVSCKVINVRSGDELPEKCRELALHFENQGTPIMIGGGVLAYTLLGVDFNESSGDCAFLILDPHYTGNDELKKIVNGGWCGWKKAVDSKGKHFFLHDKFYNLLLPQRPNMSPVLKASGTRNSSNQLVMALEYSCSPLIHTRYSNFHHPPFPHVLLRTLPPKSKRPFSISATSSPNPSTPTLPFLQDQEQEQDDPLPQREENEENLDLIKDPIFKFFKTRSSIQQPDPSREGKLTLQKNRRTSWHLATQNNLDTDPKPEPDTRPEPKTKNTQLGHLTDEGIVGEILELSRNLPKNETLGELLGGYEGKVGKNDCVEVLDGSGRSCDGLLVEPSLVTPRACSALFTVLGRAAMGDELMVVFGNLPDGKEFKDVYVYNAAMSGLLCCGRYDDAWKVYETMEINNVQPDHVTCSIMITIMRKKGNSAKDAWLFFESMNRKGASGV
ncbi:hypothetical protein RJ639_008763 [Escallonia herrerae]|uniref:Rhodanese domain-containing protein n=1 Tax=Escallonia herrerae TaxID=1293975 RepID=A0AA89AXD6_9ASTE|nr:hypothetical protein RJ639_008763 [Escallonia herrerae]